MSETDLIRALRIASREIEVPIVDVLSSSHSQRATRARALTMHLMVVGAGHRRHRVAKLLDRHHTTVQHALEGLENQRSSPVVDEWLTRLESEIRRSPERGRVCPQCTGERSMVTQTRGDRRRRVCLDCGSAWSTREVIS